MTLHRTVALDGLRGIAAIVVVFRHTLNAIPVAPGPLRMLIESPAAVLLNAQGAVQLFFVLSGFVLAASLERARASGTSGRSLAAFFAKRIMRIHLPYVAAVVLSWLASFAFVASTAGPGLTRWIATGTQVDLDVAQLLTTFAFPGPALGLLPQGWTLAVEMVYSLLLPLLFWMGRRSLWLLVGLSLVLLFVSPPGSRMLYYGVDFCLGIAVYLERERIAARLSSFGTVANAAVVLAGLCLFASPMLLGWSVWSEGHGFYISGIAREEILLMGVGSAILVAAAFAMRPFADVLSWRPFAFLGRISFSLYLLHWVWIVLLAPRIDSGSRGLDAALLYGGVLALSLASSLAFERMFDRPAVRGGRTVSGWISGSGTAPRPAPHRER